MYSKGQFRYLVDTMVCDYGVRSYLNNIEEDMTQDEIDDDLWFETPCCQDIICYEDIDANWEEILKNGMCPICENPFDEE